MVLIAEEELLLEAEKALEAVQRKAVIEVDLPLEEMAEVVALEPGQAVVTEEEMAITITLTVVAMVPAVVLTVLVMVLAMVTTVLGMNTLAVAIMLEKPPLLMYVIDAAKIITLLRTAGNNFIKMAQNLNTIM